MRTHGSRQQQDAVRTVPGKQMQKVYEVGAGTIFIFQFKHAQNAKLGGRVVCSVAY